MIFKSQIIFGILIAAAIPTLLWAVDRHQLLQEYASTTVLSVTPTDVPIHKDNNYVLDCSDCAQVSKDGLCLNTNDKTAFCRNLNDTENGKIRQHVGVLCIQCPVITKTPSLSITPTITPPPGCFYQTKVCTILCTRNNPNCCVPVLICPSGTPTTTPSPSISAGPSQGI